LRHSYIAAKHAIIGLTKSIAMEGLADNIRVNAVAPEPVHTARSGRGQAETTPEQRARRLEEDRAAGGRQLAVELTAYAKLEVRLTLNGC